METFTHNGLTVAYRDVGEGPPIIMLHNGGTSSVIWREQVATLSDDHRVIAVDLPGFGDSPRPAVAAHLGDLVDLIAALMEHLGLGPALAVGNCMGSNIAVNLSHTHPDRLTGILAVNPLTEASFSGGRIGFLHRMERIAGGPTRALRSLSRRIRIPRFAGTPTLRFLLGRKGIGRGLHHDPELLACQFRPDQLPALVDVLDDMAAYGGIDDERRDATVPTWIAWGEQNRVLSRTRGAHLGKRLNADRVEVIDGTGHLPMLEDPEAVTALIEELLEATA